MKLTNGFGTVLFMTVSVILQTVYTEKILVVSFLSSKSHKLTYMPLIEELGKRGHDITILSPVKATKSMKNVKEILTMDAEEVEDKMRKEKNMDMYERKEQNKNMNPFLMVDLFQEICRDTYDLPVVQAILKESFDLIFFQPMFNDCALGLVHRIKAPLVLFSPISVASFMAEKVGTHFPPSITPNIFLGYPEEMNFFQRFVNYGVSILIEGILRFYYEPGMEAVYREKLGEDIPPVRDILGNASLILSNGHFSLHRPKPYFPDIVDVGGIHSQAANPLPKDLEDFIKQGKDGFIYFSMGSSLKGSQMPEEKRKIFLNVFSKLKQKVLWKWETETMDDLPKNVKLSKWLPQQDLLGHKDIKMFISHCGGGSTEEAIYHGAPVLGFPMFGDQPMNAKLAKNHGFIVEMDWNKFTEEDLLASIQEILNNQKYKHNVQRLSDLYKDQPDDALKRAVYWVEYVIRHKGAMHLRTAGRKLNFFQYHSYDVILTYLALIYILLYVMYVVTRFIVTRLCCRSSQSTTKKSKRD